MRYLTVALTKGRLAQTNAGYCLNRLESPAKKCVIKDTRKLIFVNEDLKLRFFLAKGPDVPTYVEYGAADIGVTRQRISFLKKERKLV